MTPGIAVVIAVVQVNTRLALHSIDQSHLGNYSVCQSKCCIALLLICESVIKFVGANCGVPGDCVNYRYRGGRLQRPGGN